MYLLTDNFLFESNDCTSIEFKLSDSNSRYLDTNRRCMVIEYVSGTKYNELSFNSFTPLSDNLITNSTTLLRKSITKLNGVKYYVNNNINFISCYIIDNEKLDMDNSIIIENTSIIILLGSRKILNWGSENYIEFLNNYPTLFHCELVDESKFKVTNFEAIDLRYNATGNFTRDYPYIPREFYLNESKIVSEFVMFMQRQFPRYTITGAISDLTNQQQKTNMLLYNAKLFDVDADIVSNVRRHPLYGKIRTGRIQINWEFVTDDFDEYVIFRDKLLLTEDIFKVTNFQLGGDYGDWWYSVVWITDVGSDIERTPSARLLSDNLLYTIQFSCELYGWIAMENKDYAQIIYPVVRMYADDWALIGSLFNKNDKNVHKYIIITDNNSNPKIILTEDNEGSIWYDNKEGIIIKDDEFGIIIDDDVINPMDFDHGTTYIIYPNLRKIFPNSNDSKTYTKIVDGVSRLAVNTK